jgi:hypothetical protein
MKEGIHPKYDKNAVITCSCGARFEVGSTKSNMRVEGLFPLPSFLYGEPGHVWSIKAAVLKGSKRSTGVKQIL